ncbi:hypothetical protein D3C72_580850 [compost metagenome]
MRGRSEAWAISRLGSTTGPVGAAAAGAAADTGAGAPPGGAMTWAVEGGGGGGAAPAGVSVKTRRLTDPPRDTVTKSAPTEARVRPSEMVSPTPTDTCRPSGRPMMAEPPPGPPARTPNRRRASLSAPAASARLLLSPVRKKASKRWKMLASTGAAAAWTATAVSGSGATKIQARRPA